MLAKLAADVKLLLKSNIAGNRCQFVKKCDQCLQQTTRVGYSKHNCLVDRSFQNEVKKG